jgi:DNA-binding FadR family transcriptional regulator
MEIEDKSGQPRSIEDLTEARIAVETAIVRDILKLPPYLGVLLPTIREALVELINRRRMEEVHPQ